MSNVKKYLVTAITLGCIAMASGLLIGATNLITKDKISENEANRINVGIAEIFGEGSKGNEDKEFEEKNYTYLKAKYEILDYAGAKVGLAYRTVGSNAYGKISLIIGFTSESLYQGLSIVVNEQSFATTLVDNYIDPLNAGEREVEDVKCGATYGATLVKEMINEATNAAKGK